MLRFDKATYLLLLCKFILSVRLSDKEYVAYLISFCKFSDVLPVFTCVSAIDNL